MGKSKLEKFTIKYEYDITWSKAKKRSYEVQLSPLP